MWFVGCYVSGYAQNHMFDQAINMFQLMLTDAKCKPDQTTLVSVLSACSHLGSLEYGKLIDSYIKKHKFELSVSLGNALIDMFAKCGHVEMQNQFSIRWLVDV
ncbi:hypothetical protein Ddye_005867 [Dipteronia dyeriana]|uniref:Pentatricopeptide repeat-containing protein n=1 Tax=Dipteronia dyeriana TaxID=168575 RepID=A0AAE0CQ43_9ROSI|nr:hypothetical protein Ddye_005867 [Dipteronia dyeriana]